MDKIFEIFAPENPLPLIFDSPHSGTIHPDDFGYACTEDDLERTEDKFVDDLFESAPDHGATLLIAKVSRSYIDLNRAPDDVDPMLIEGEWPFGEIKPTPRSAAGIGLLRRLIKPGVPVYDRKLSPEEVMERVKKYYIPYHKTLAELMNEAHYNYGQVWHVNCHSMPSTSARTKRAIGFVGNEPQTPDFVIGNRDGTTAGPDFTRAVKEHLEDLGYAVALNDPFKGVELVERYSMPTAGRHSIQLEINKALFMDEATNKKDTKKYKGFKADIETLIKFCADYARSNLRELAAD
ncbi:MAG: N-formylglutamate amidohydrolase [Alphaproteobacteria bacterium]|nr:N-formylglutamate amidohydrolase [Alphaproteobacteria bacterium]